jgi:hypothetical protein
MVSATVAVLLHHLLLADAEHPSSATAALKISLQPPSLVGASNDSATHYWFPTDSAVVFNASHFLIDARLADDCSDYFCNHSTTCKPSDPSHQISMSTDGGRSFVPQWNVGGVSPWSPEVAKRPFLGPSVLVLNTTTQLALYQGKTWAPWKTTAVLFSLDPASGLSYELAERPVSYEGADTVCGTGHLWNQGVIQVSDGGGWILSAQCDVKVGKGPSERKESSILLFSSHDGYRWNLTGPALPAVAPAGATPCDSPGENTIVELTGAGGWLLIARCGDGLPLLGWVSQDRGRSWRRHKLPPTMHGVMPVAVRMDNGAIVLVTGRGGLALWLNRRGDGKEWTLTNLAEAHNKLVLQNQKLDGLSLQYTAAFVAFNATKESTSYSTLRKLGGNDGVVCYDRLSSSDAVPDKPSCSPPGNRDKNDHVFCMRFHLATS